MQKIQAQFNAYDDTMFRSKFENTDLYRSLSKDFLDIVYDKEVRHPGSARTPRQQLGDPSCASNKFFASAFYYLEFLTSKQPASIYDLGCGWNIFKRYIPNIIGVDATDPTSETYYADIHAFIDDSYIKEHYQAFESAFSICALHFIPISQLRNRVLDFISMIKPGGRGWLSLNAQRLVERDIQYRRSFESNSALLDSYIRSQLVDLPVELLVFDVFVLPPNNPDNAMNGNIHIVFEKPQV